MSSSAKRMLKLRQGQSEDEVKAQREKDIEYISWVVTRYADANSCPEKSHCKDSVKTCIAHRIQKEILSSRYSSPDDDSQCGDDSSQQLSLGLLHAMNLLRFSYSVMQLRGAFFSGCFDLSIEKRNFLLRSSSPDDDSQCGDDSSLQLNVGLMHTKNLFLNSCSTMHLRNTHLPVVLILSTETLMDFSFGNEDRHGSSTLRWIGSVASQSVYSYVPCDSLMPISMRQCRDGSVWENTHLGDEGRPKYCSPSEQAPCPAGFSCQESLAQSGVYVCCTDPSYKITLDPLECPPYYTPSLDIDPEKSANCHLLPADPNPCPSDAACFQARNRTNGFLCCRSAEPSIICPISGQYALLKSNGQPETCDATSTVSVCSNSTYTCQFSHVLQSHVCCGNLRTIVCADGRETFIQEKGKTFACNPLDYPTTCPSGYECALSDTRDINVCCRRDQPQAPHTYNGSSLIPTSSPPPATVRSTFGPPAAELRCPAGWSAFEDSRGARRFGQGPWDATCPEGFSSVQSSVTGIFMCCRLSSTTTNVPALKNSTDTECRVDVRTVVLTFFFLSVQTRPGGDPYQMPR
ncbi:lustrin, cysteine-rich repeated domain-containing protein [Ditylenchus destructor]|nr:lustrin, cysteine-rich repeated domain-containing protein [Ditylenchus destructor]